MKNFINERLVTEENMLDISEEEIGSKLFTEISDTMQSKNSVSNSS